MSHTTYFFSDAATVQRLRTAAADWRHTPFRFGSRAKGPAGGIDCVGLVEELMAAAGIERFQFERTPADNSRHVYNDKILTYLRGTYRIQAKTCKHGNPQPFLCGYCAEEDQPAPEIDPQSAILASRFAELPLPEKKKRTAFVHYYEPPFMPGDLLIMKTGRGLYHMPVLLTETTFIQCALPDGVTEGDILAPNYHDFLVACFRARALPIPQSAIRDPHS